MKTPEKVKRYEGRGHLEFCFFKIQNIFSVIGINALGTFCVENYWMLYFLRRRLLSPLLVVKETVLLALSCK